MKRTLFSAVLFVLLLAILAVPAVALPQEYTVEPAFGTIGAAATDVVPITFWNLNLREMTIIGALALSPLLLIPVEIFFALKLLSFLGFRRIARGNVLANSVRNTLYVCIRERPGISLGELAGEAGISRGALAYHLTLLRALGKIVMVKNHSSISCFENSGTYNCCEQKMLSCLRTDTGRKILRALAMTPGLSRAELGQVLGLSGPTVTWHMKRLAADGIVTVSREGKCSRHAISIEMTAFLKRTGCIGRFSSTSPVGEGSAIPRAALAGSAES
jgi:predicted transcriptional regulator